MIKKTWTLNEANALFTLPFNELMYQAQTIHRQHFNPNTVQVSTLLSIKTGRCPEDCSYCPQSGHYKTGLQQEPLLEIEAVIAAAERAKAAGSTRFCMGAAWRGPSGRDLATVCDMVSAVKALGLETCVTLGLLKTDQARQLKDAGLDFYNHNIDTSPEFYAQVITTRTFQDRLDTLAKIRESGIKVCSGGILGLGETNTDRLNMLVVLANLDEPPESIPINQLIPIPGTPLGAQRPVDCFDFVRTIAVCRILVPMATIRLSAGREHMSDELQALCFMAGANSIFYGEKLLTASNPEPEHDNQLFHRLGLNKLELTQAAS